MNIGKTQQDTIARAEAAIAEAQPVARRDVFRPGCHFRAPANWMNDICGALWHDGYYHIFYQFNPFSDHCDWSCVNACWGHARSRDLVHWDYLPIAIAPSGAEGNCQCASGCATHRADGTPMLFYGHTPLSCDGVRQAREQRAALPLDGELRTWHTFDIGLAPGKSGVPANVSGCWTDMFVFREAGRTFAMFKEAGGLIVEAQNPELTHWRTVGRIDGVFGECPNFVRIQDRWLLLRSSYPMTWQVGRFDAERIRFEMDGPSGIVDYAYGLAPPADPCDQNYERDGQGLWICRSGAPYPVHSHNRGFYATSTFADPAGRMLMFGWVSAFRPQGWNCCTSLPRVLTLDSAGRLVQKPVSELAVLRERHEERRKIRLDHTGISLENISDRSLEIIVTARLDMAEHIECALRTPDEPPAVQISGNRNSINVNGTVVPRMPGSDPEEIALHLFFDRSLVEVFIDGGLQAVTRVAYPASPKPLHFECCACGGVAVIQSLDVWTLKSVWPTDDQFA